jgi:hypothetical protein
VGEHRDLRSTTPKEIEEIVLLNDDYLRENTAPLISQDPLRVLKNNTLIVIFGGLLRSSL